MNIDKVLNTEIIPALCHSTCAKRYYQYKWCSSKHLLWFFKYEISFLFIYVIHVHQRKFGKYKEVLKENKNQALSSHSVNKSVSNSDAFPKRFLYLHLPMWILQNWLCSEYNFVLNVFTHFIMNIFSFTSF